MHMVMCICSCSCIYLFPASSTGHVRIGRTMKNSLALMEWNQLNLNLMKLQLHCNCNGNLQCIIGDLLVPKYGTVFDISLCSMKTAPS